MDPSITPQLPHTAPDDNHINPPLTTNKTYPVLKIIHFNDVYDVDRKQYTMGVVNFKTKVDYLKNMHPNSLLLFSGDCLSPSSLTNIKGGWQMVYSLNTLNIDAACYGNHEFDFTRYTTLKLATSCNFPWLLGNITFLHNGATLGNGLPYFIKQHGQFKVGFIGVAGYDWIGILSDEYYGYLYYEDCAQYIQRTANKLLNYDNCNILIGLTHMRNYADRQLAAKVTCLDIILGGHDHVIMEEIINGTAVLKSGSNFKYVRYIELYNKTHKSDKQGNRFNYYWYLFKIVDEEVVDLALKQYIDEIKYEYSKFDAVVGYSYVDLYTRFYVIRLAYSNYGNFITDLTRLYYGCDVAVINSGSIRNDLVIPAGELVYSKVANIINSPLVIKRVPGELLLKILYHSVAATPYFSGSFLMVSGIRLYYDWKSVPKVQKVTIGGVPLNPHKFYMVSSTSYIARGGDGYEPFANCELVLDEIHAVTMLYLLLKFFKAPDAQQEYASIAMSSSSDNLDDEPMPVLVKKPSVRIGRIKELRSGFRTSKDESRLTCISPVVDGRIKCTTVV